MEQEQWDQLLTTLESLYRIYDCNSNILLIRPWVLSYKNKSHVFVCDPGSNLNSTYTVTFKSSMSANHETSNH